MMSTSDSMVLQWYAHTGVATHITVHGIMHGSIHQMYLTPWICLARLDLTRS